MYRVMIVDDEPLVLEQLHMLLNEPGGNIEIVQECQYGQAALEAIPRVYPDILITDVSMPDMDGLTLIEQARQLKTENPIFLVLTAYRNFQDVQKALRLGVQGYLLKPVMKEELYAVLNKAIQKKEALRREECLQNYLPNLQAGEQRTVIEQFYGRIGIRPEEITFGSGGEYHALLKEIARAVLETNEEQALQQAAAYARACTQGCVAPSAVHGEIIGLLCELSQNAELGQVMELEIWVEWEKKCSSITAVSALLDDFITQSCEMLRTNRLAQKNEALQKVKSYMDCHFSEKVTLNSLAEQFFMNPVYLGQAFYRQFGISPHQYLAKQRMEHARGLIAQGCSLQKVAELVGYENYATFKSNFIRLTGGSPASYKKVCEETTDAGQEKNREG